MPLAVISFWDMAWGPAGYAEAGQKIVEQYNRGRRGVQVEYRCIPWSEWPDVFAQAVMAGKAPDLSCGGAYQAVQYYAQGEILDLDDVFAELQRSGKAKDFISGALESQQYQGHSIALPWAMDIRIPYYRKDLFARAGLPEPASWDELRAAAKALTAGGRYGLATCGGANEAMQLLFVLMINNGGGLFTSEGKLNVLNERNVEALSFFAEIVRDGSLHPDSLSFDLAAAHRAFGNGDAAILFDPPGLEVALPEQAENIGLMAPLRGPHGDRGTFYSINNIMLYRQSKNPAAAKDFLMWWSENQKPLWTEGRCDQIPVRTSIAADPFFYGRPFVRQILDQWAPLGRTTAAQSQAIFPELNAIEGDGAMQTLVHELMQGNEVLAAMQKAKTRLEQSMRPAE